MLYLFDNQIVISIIINIYYPELRLIIQKSHGAGIGGVSSLVHKLVKLNPVKQTRNELKLGVVKFAQPITYNDLRANEGRETKALNCKPITNL
jgi:hypothetical protein